MNKKEKEAIKLLEEYLNFGNKEGVLCKNLRTIFTIIEQQQNLIDKQQKEIKDMRKELDLDEETEIAPNNRIMDLEREIDKQKKVIDEMEQDIYDSQIECNRYFRDKEEVKQYFIRKAEEDE